MNLDCCDEIIRGACELDEWQNSHVLQRDNLGNSESVYDHTQRNAFVLSRKNYPKGYEKFERYLGDIHQSVSEIWDIKGDIVWSGTQLIRYRSGGFFVPHRDSSDMFPERVITVQVYLNDNYQGGETQFHCLDEKIIPKRGKVLSFPSDLVHSALPVSQGEKFVFVTWAIVSKIEWI